MNADKQAKDGRAAGEDSATLGGFAADDDET
jgi:hypothetical protein